MAESTKKINVAFRVTEARQEELKILSARRRQSIQSMLEQGLELLLEKGHQPPVESTARLDRWHAMLAEILSSDDRGAIIAVQENLKTFHRLVELGGQDGLQGDERRLLEEYRNGSMQKKQRMLAFVAKTEDLGPEVMERIKGRDTHVKGEAPRSRRAGGK